MAKKHKTHQTQHDKQKMAAAQHRNEFFSKLNYMITKLTGNPTLFKSLPEQLLMDMYKTRFHAIRIEVEPGHKIPHEVFRYTKVFLLGELRNTTRKFTDDGPEFPVDLFISVGFTLITFVSIARDDSPPYLLTLRDSLPMARKDRATLSEFFMKIFHEEMVALAYAISYSANVFPQIVFWADYGPLKSRDDDNQVYSTVRLKCYEPQRKQFIIDGQNRPAFEICVGKSNRHLDKLAYKAEDLGINIQKSSLSLPLYIQNHALNRLYERLDGILKNAVYFWLIRSLLKKDIRKGNNNNYLIAYYIEERKLGYLVADIRDAHILIHTFLFITNEGTPEGNLLMANTGLGKLDISYLKINKLSTFINSDIASNPEVKRIFIEAGCTALFDKLPSYFFEESNSKTTVHIADKIRSYLANQKNDLDEPEAKDMANG